jgi:hypothetical protein
MTSGLSGPGSHDTKYRAAAPAADACQTPAEDFSWNAFTPLSPVPDRHTMSGAISAETTSDG